ncbi:pentapeptide repeat-containing protein [Streptomyces griseoflavus]|uniref:pentapeptide repeat-containing protein n=1 Tax=Streptomyces griseoflavus TaxID=35619 RepID=UPI003D72C081
MTDETSTSEEKRPNWRRMVRLIAGSVAALAFTWLVVWVLIWGVWELEHDRIYVTGKNDEETLVQAAGIIVTGFRTSVIALIAGIFTLIGLHYTRRKHALELQQFRHTQEQFAESQKQFETTLRETQERDQRQSELTREGQVTGRYVEAIKLLASDKIHEQLGGIYSLERILRDSDRDRATIVAVLAAYVRTRLDGTDKRLEHHMLEYGEEAAHLPLAEDIRAALTVLGRNYSNQQPRADLRSVNLDGWNATEITLQGALMVGAELQGAILKSATLVDAQLQYANLKRAMLVDVHASDANFTEADLREVKLRSAWLDGAVLRGAKLNDAKLDYACLVGADLFGANLEEADLSGSDLDRATLHRARNLTVAQICMANIYSSTKLPGWLAEDPTVQGRIRTCDEAKAAGEKPPPTDPVAFWVNGHD